MTDFYDILLKQHLIYEFTHGRINNDIILETRSIVPNIDNIVNTIMDNVKKQIIKTLDSEQYNDNSYGISDTENETTQTYTEKDFTLENCFFNKFKFKIKFKLTLQPTYKGGFAPLDSFIYNRKTEQYDFEPYIMIMIGSNNFNDFCSKFKFSIAHELTHAYGYYQYYLKHGKPQSKEDILSYGLLRQQNSMFNSIDEYEKKIALLHYKLSLKELNAFLGQLRQELLNNREQIKDSKSAFELIKNTESYIKIFSYIKTNIELICSIKDKSLQQAIIKYTNQIANKSFTTYNQIVKYYQTKWYKWSKLYLTKASKIAYDIFDKYGTIFT